jgi:hypothetical protein
MKVNRLKLFVIALSFSAIAVLLSGSMISTAVACTISQRWDFGEAVLGTPKTAVVNLILYVPVGYPSDQITLTSFGFKNGQISPFKILTSIPQAGIPLSTEQSVKLEIAFIPSTLGLSEDVLTLSSNMPGVCGEVTLCGTGVEDITTIEDVIRFFDSSVNSGALRGTGGQKTYKNQQGFSVSAVDTQAPDKAAENHLYALRNMIEAAGMLLEKLKITMRPAVSLKMSVERQMVYTRLRAHRTLLKGRPYRN